MGPIEEEIGHDEDEEKEEGDEEEIELMDEGVVWTR